MIENLVKEIQARSLYLTVIGSGYVGLPTAALFANAGFHVIAVDIKPEVIEAVNSGFSPINEPGLKELVSRNVQAGRLRAALNSAIPLSQEDTVIISVQTPIDQNKKPNLSFLMEALEEIGKNVKKGMLVVVCSTVPPGTMLEKVKPMLESLSGLKGDTDFYLAYTPERIAPGKALKEFVENPRLVGGVGPNSTKTTAELFRTVCKKVIETDASTAEVAKLAENTFRDVNIAFANELALICEELGVDVMDVIKLANTHPRVSIHKPGCGVGGPCLPKDPYLLLYRSKGKSFQLQTTVIELSRKLNDDMPLHTVELVIDALKSVEKDVYGHRIAILGTAYKSGVGGSENSPAEKIIEKLMGMGAEVIAYDPYLSENFGAKKAVDLYEAVRGADCIIIVTDHEQFGEMNLSKIKELMRENPVIVDGRRVVNPAEAGSLGFKYYGIGIRV